MQILIIGNGAREHALAWKCAQSPLINSIFIAPGNAGTATEMKCQNVTIEINDIAALLSFAKQQHIDFTIVGPEAPLCAGIVDAFVQANLKCLGPTKAAAELENSKVFTKHFLKKYHIPTAAYQTFTDAVAAKNYLTTQKFPLVVKADGLAAGKGVVIAHSLIEAENAINDMLIQQKFGAAGQSIVIEEFLRGEEASFIVFTDGKHVIPLVTSQDHKARDDGDRGPNTGGMGAYSPAPIITTSLQEKILQEIIYPTLAGMREENRQFTGFLYAGLMIENDHARVLEFNCRLGDPETEIILMRLQSDLVELCLAYFDQHLASVNVMWDPSPALCVVLASPGYPEKYPQHLPIHLPTELNSNCKIFHAGTILKDKQIVSNGGRVLCVTGKATTLAATQQQVYATIAAINPNPFHFRHDIGYRALMRS